MNEANSQINPDINSIDDDELLHELPVVVSDDDDTDDDREPGAGRAPIDLDSAYDVSDLNAIFERTGKPAKKVVKAAPGPDLTIDTTPPIDDHAPPATGISPEREKELLAEVDAEKTNTLRAIADLHNFRRRAEDDRKRLVAVANERLIKDLLPLVDDFDRSLAAAKQTQSYELLVDGVEAVVRKIADTLAKEGVQPIPTVGEKFDPDYHDAVMVDEGSDLPDETITEEFRKGYTMHQRVIRPALVKVAKS